LPTVAATKINNLEHIHCVRDAGAEGTTDQAADGRPRCGHAARFWQTTSQRIGAMPNDELAACHARKIFGQEMEFVTAVYARFIRTSAPSPLCVVWGLVVAVSRYQQNKPLLAFASPEYPFVPRFVPQIPASAVEFLWIFETLQLVAGMMIAAHQFAELAQDSSPLRDGGAAPVASQTRARRIESFAATCPDAVIAGTGLSAIGILKHAKASGLVDGTILAVPSMFIRQAMLMRESAPLVRLGWSGKLSPWISSRQ
jgi:hypothetical protein